MGKERFDGAPDRLSNQGTPGGGLGGLLSEIVGWVRGRMCAAGRHAPRRLAVLERIALGPRHSLALVEAEGRRLLIAISPEGAPAFHALGSLQTDAAAMRALKSKTDSAYSIAMRTGSRMRERAARMPRARVPSTRALW